MIIKVKIFFFKKQIILITQNKIKNQYINILKL